MDKVRISSAGDGFYAAANHRPDTEETPHGCYDGCVYMDFKDEDENGDHVELVERVPCRRCNRESL